MLLFTLLTRVEAVLAALLIVVGGTVEGYGYGLSLGTRWPYTSSMPRLALAGDPEVWHRVIATLIGILSVVILAVDRSWLALTGLLLIVFTALLGMATLHVLAGRAPSFVQGLHDVLAYLTLITYLILGFSDANPLPSLGGYILHTVVLHSFFLVIFLGGMVTGQRGFKRAIGFFVRPKTSAQWVWLLHGIAVLILLLTFSYYADVYTFSLIVALLQVAVGVVAYQSVNQSAARPGAVVPLHQLLSVLIVVGVFFTVHFSIPLLG
ncbi:MAG: cytochrome C oxidase assembly protein [Thermoprotei archaeon]